MIEELHNDVGIRVRIKKKSSNYYNLLGSIIASNCDGTFRVVVTTEGKPQLNLYPEEVDPC